MAIKVFENESDVDMATFDSFLKTLQASMDSSSAVVERCMEHLRFGDDIYGSRSLNQNGSNFLFSSAPFSASSGPLSTRLFYWSVSRFGEGCVEMAASRFSYQAHHFLLPHSFAAFRDVVQVLGA